MIFRRVDAAAIEAPADRLVEEPALGTRRTLRAIHKRVIGMGEAAQRRQVDWAAVRRDYELTDETIADLCKRHGVSKGSFEHQFRKGRWLSRQAANADRQGSTLDRLFAVLERQVAKLANETGDTLGDKEAQQLSDLVKTFDKLSSVRNGETDNGGPAQKKDMRDLRDKLAKRIDQFKRR